MNNSFVDLTGQRFGKLTVIERQPKVVGQRTIVGWLCQCDCGNSFTALSNDLRSGKTISCGCARRTVPAMPKEERLALAAKRARNWRKKKRDEQGPLVKPEHGNGFKDLTGQQFGRLTVLSESKEKTRETRRACWLCRCECGKERVFISTDLLSGGVQSCGCLRNTLHGLSPAERLEHIRKRQNRIMQDWRNRWATPKRCRQHGITIEIYKTKLSEQNGGCRICGKANENGYPLSIDHDHSCCPTSYGCGKCFRGLLCHNCNVLLGMAGDSVEALHAAIVYLQASRQSAPASVLP